MGNNNNIKDLNEYNNNAYNNDGELIQINSIIDNNAIKDNEKEDNYNKDEEERKLYYINATNSKKNNINENKLLKKTKEKIFLIKRIKKQKRGPKSIYQNKRKFVHAKIATDNIVKKIIRNFIKYLINKINKKIKSKQKLKIIKPNLTKLRYNKIYKYMISTTLGEMLSGELSDKYSTLKKKDKYYNKNIIHKIYENYDDNERLIEVLNLNVSEIYEIYINKQKEKKISDFNGLEEDIKKISVKNDKKYQEKYRNIALGLIQILKKRGRETIGNKKKSIKFEDYNGLLLTSDEDFISPKLNN